MRKYWLFALASLLLAGCGGSSGDFFGNNVSGNGNFISTTVNVEQKYLYLLNRQENTLSVYLIPQEEEEEEPALEPEEVEGSPFSLGPVPVTDITVAADSFLLTLDQSSTLKTYRINAGDGSFELIAEQFINVMNPRKLVHDGVAVGVLGDSLSLLEIQEDGTFSPPAVVADTTDWVDLELSGRAVYASTAAGASGFTWEPAQNLPDPEEIALPAGGRGELALLGHSIYVVNAGDDSLSRLAIEEEGDLSLDQTLNLPASLTSPFTIAAAFEEELLVGDSDSVSLIHPEESELVEESSVELEREPSELFPVPDSVAVVVAHETGSGATFLLLEDGELVVSEGTLGETGPASVAFAQAITQVTETIEP